MKQSTPAIKKATAYLSSMLERQIWKAGDLLPSISKLALSAGVSSVPMWKAVNILAEQGVLEVVQGSGTRVSQTNEEPLNVLRKGWLGLRDRIHRDILSGMYPPGALMPSLKEMRVHYGVSYQTLRKSLDSLVAEGSIVPEHRTYRTVSFAPQKAHSSVVLLGWSHPTIEMQERTPWGEEFLRVCENMCSRMKVNLQVVRYTASDGFLTFIYQDGSTATKLKNDASILGYLLWAESPAELYRQVLAQLDGFRKPIAVLQEGSQLRLSDIAERCRELQIFSIATSSHAARNVASFLLQQGHTSIAYFSPFHKSDWSRARLCGLQEIYQRNGDGANVKPFTLDHYGYTHEYTDLLKPPEILFQKLTPFISELHFVPGLVMQAANRLKPNLMKLLIDEVVRAFMQPFFRTAITNQDCTAWVCASDYAAFMAMDFLKKNATQKIAVIGFDDTFEAFRRGLTSYNFNINGLVQLMLGHLLNPSAHAFSKRVKSQEIEGMLVVRNTSFKKMTV